MSGVCLDWALSCPAVRVSEVCQEISCSQQEHLCHPEVSLNMGLKIPNLYHLSVHCPLSSPVQGCIRSSSPCHGKCSPGEAGDGLVACGDECIPQYLGKCFAPNHGDQHTVV